MKNKLLKTLTPLVLVVLLIATLASVFVLTAGAADTTGTAVTTGTTQSFVKVTATPTDWSGEYLIVYEDGNVAFDGSLAKLDAASNTVSVEISNNKIIYTDDLANSTFTINAGGNIKSKSGYYIGNTSNTNALSSSTSTTYTNTISIDNGNLVIKSSGGAYLRYNSDSNQLRFRYYKSSSYTSQKAIALYKLVENTNPDCQHANTNEVAEVPATCTEKGYTAGVLCKDCGIYTEGHEEISATGHTDVKDPAVDATCTATGLTEGKHCSVCGEVLVEQTVIPKKSHNYDENGECTVCHEKQPTKITINRNSFGEVSGYAWHGWTATATTDEKISGSGYIYGTTTSSIQINSKQPGCHIYNTTALPGKIVSITLTVTSTSSLRNFYVLTSDTAFGQSTPDTSNATLKQVTTSGATWEFDTTGKYFAIVVTGGAANLSSIEITYEVCSHANKKPIGEAKAATCTEDGFTAGSKCSDCGEILEKQTVIPATGHTDDDNNYICDVCGEKLCKEHAWIETSRTDATCTENGSAEYECTTCHDTKTETLAATGHTEVIDAAVPATCTATGLTEGKHCSVCDEVIVAQETVAIIDHIYENGFCTMCGKVEPVIPFKVGDVVIFTGSKVDGTNTQELTGFADGAKYGTANAYSDVPAGTFLIKVVEGYESGTYAFKNGDKYITCNGEKNVNLSTTLDVKSSWKVQLSVDGELEIISCSNSSYYLQYNPSDPRFTTYTGSQQPIKVVKVEPKITTVGASLNTGVKIRVTYNIPEAWLNANAGAKVMFSCNGTTQVIDAVAGVYTYSVNLAPTFMNKALTVQIVDSNNGNAALTAAEDVSLTTYKAKLEAAHKIGTLEGFTDEKYHATINLIDAALKCSYVANGDHKGSIVVNNFVASAAVKGNEGYGVTVNGSLGANASLVITVTGATPASVTIGGNAVGTIEGNTITITGIYHTMFNDEIVISDGTNAIFTFSFNTYLEAIYDSETDGSFQKNFAAATYLYGVAAEAYIIAK